ncbi:MAG: quinone oxidoreductase [Rhizobiaceae bacterium]|nr:quinone oxidoreductase [Rhizobiaceae bacterium]
MTKAMQIYRTGGPEVLTAVDIVLPPPGPREVRVRHTAIGVNFVDVNYRTGLYPIALPAILGNEATGVVESVGSAVREVVPGERVAYCDPTGAYCEARNIAVDRVAAVPDAISDEQAAAIMLKGLTASCMVHRCAPIRAGEPVLIQAVTGGVGLLLCQWAKHLGAITIGTVGSADKAAIARNHGCDHVISYRDVDFVGEVRRIAPEGVAAVFDGVGRDTYYGSLDCLRPFGVMVAFGNTSGPLTNLTVRDLSERGCLFLTRPKLRYYVGDHAALAAAAEELFALVGAGTLRVDVNHRYALVDAACAHADLQARRTSGSIVLLPCATGQQAGYDAAPVQQPFATGD